MITAHHLNCVRIVSPLASEVCGHCLLVKENSRLVLIDTGIGMLDCRHPEERIGKELIESVGYRFEERLTAYRQIERLGLDPASVTDCIITHLDNDHIGGLADFPGATVHVGAEELANYNSGNPRYLKAPMAHGPRIRAYGREDLTWFGFEARRIDAGIGSDILLIPLFGHTHGQCGVAVRMKDRWLFHAADAYYLRAELTEKGHPVEQLSRMRADDDRMRVATVARIQRLAAEHPEIDVFCYHDMEEFERLRGPE